MRHHEDFAAAAQDAAAASRPRLIFRVVDGLLVVADLTRGDLHVLNHAAGRLFLELLDTPSSPDDIADRWAIEFELDGAVARRDIAACLSQWDANGWMTRRKDGTVVVHSLTSAPPTPARPAASAPADPPIFARRLALNEERVDIAFHQTSAASSSTVIDRGIALFSGVPERAADDRPARRVALAADGSSFRVGVDDIWIEGQDEVDALGLAISAVYAAAYPHHEILATFHAAAVAMGGSLTVFPGISGAGKSTLTAHLVAKGWHYGSDDFLALADGGEAGPLLLPLPNAISLKDGSLAVLAEHYPDLRSLPVIAYGPKLARFLPVDPASHIRDFLPVGQLVFTRYRAGTAHGLSPVTAAEALLGLIEAGFSTGVPFEAERFEKLLDWIERVPKYRLDYDDLEEARLCLEMPIAPLASAH